jgi:hypothetical protein
MSFCLPMAYMGKKPRAAAGSEAEMPLLAGEHAPAKHSELKQIALLSIPTFFDLAATVCGAGALVVGCGGQCWVWEDAGRGLQDAGWGRFGAAAGADKSPRGSPSPRALP